MTQIAEYDVVSGVPTLSRTFGYGYQAHQHYLTSFAGTGMGTRDWTYDGIGNRTSEQVAEVAPQPYNYVKNGTGKGPGGGNTPLLKNIAETTATYTYNAAGALAAMQRASGSVTFALGVLDDERLGSVSRSTGESSSFSYDGRSFLRSADEASTGGYSRPTYSSAGVVHHLERRDSTASPVENVWYVYLAGRPVAQYTEVAGGASQWTYLTVDHLGTPLLATDASGSAVWQGPLDPFGADPLRDTPSGALEAGLRLRLPGQWEDEIWQDATLGADVYYNVHRWYEMGTGRYTRVDPLGLEGGLNLFGYAQGNPLFLIDVLGLDTAQVCCRPIHPAAAIRWVNVAIGLVEALIPQTRDLIPLARHCYIRQVDDAGKTVQTWGLLNKSGLAKARRGDDADKGYTPRNGECGAPICFSEEMGRCLDTKTWEYATRKYPVFAGGVTPGWPFDSTAAPNSNSFAQVVSSSCGVNEPGFVSERETPGWFYWRLAQRGR